MSTNLETARAIETKIGAINGFKLEFADGK